MPPEPEAPTLREEVVRRGKGQRSGGRLHTRLAERAAASLRVQAYRGRELPAGDADVARVLRDIADEPWNPLLHAMHGDMRRQRQEYDAACAAWEAAIKCWDTHDEGAVACLLECIAEVNELLCRTEAAVNTYGKAAAAYRRARQGPLPTIARDNYAWREAVCLMRAGDFERVTELLSLVRSGPNATVFEHEVAALERELTRTRG